MSADWVRRLDELVPVVGRSVRLEALATSHHAGLCSAGLDEDLWRWTVSSVRTTADMTAYVDEALGQRGAGTAYPFVIIDRATDRIAGSTRFGSMDASNRRLEIGWTWLGRAWQRTALNTEAKYLLLCAAFEQLGCVRVEFKTDVLNERSRAALSRIGAREEGILRSHMITATGRIRDSVYFSVIDREWPDVKRTLEAKLVR